MRSILVFLCGLSLQALATPMTVIVDPGHGGVDDGAVRAGHRESNITLEVSKKVAELLRRDRRFIPVLTRESNRALSLSERAQIAKQKKGDVFVSIHVNSSPDPKARGAEFYFQNQLPPDEASMMLAHRENSADDALNGGVPYDFLEKNSYPADVSTIVGDLLDSDRVLRSSQLSKAIKLSWRGSRKSKNNSVRQAPFFVLSHMSIPSTLVELGFLTHPSDLADLTDEKVQRRMAEDIYLGLKNYKESMDKSEALP